MCIDLANTPLAISHLAKRPRAHVPGKERRSSVLDNLGCNSVFSSGCDELRIKTFGKDQDLNSP